MASSTQTQQLRYGTHLWDKLSTLEQSTSQRSQHQSHLTKFFDQFTTSLTQFHTDISQATSVLSQQDTASGSVIIVMDQFTSQLSKLANCLQTQSQSLDLDKSHQFDINYSQQNGQLLKQCGEIWHSLGQSRQQMSMKQTNYNTDMQELEQLQQMVVNEPQLKYLESHTRKVKQQHQHTVDSEIQYEKQVEIVNQNVTALNTTYLDNLNELQLSDQSAIQQVQKTFTQFAGILEKIGNAFNQCNSQVVKLETNANQDIEEFITQNQTLTAMIDYEQFQNFESEKLGKIPKITQDQLEFHKQVSQEWESINSEDETVENDRQLVYNIVRQLIFESRPITYEQTNQLKQLLQQGQTRDAMQTALNEIGNNIRMITKHECFEILGDVMRFLLTMFVHEEFIDNHLLYCILHSSSHLFVSIPGSRKRYLYQVLSDHQIWRSSYAWSQCINSDLKEKVDAAQERRRLREQREAEEIKSFAQKIALASQKLKGLIQTKEEKLIADLKECASLVYYQLSQFISFFINYNLPFEQANQLLQEACERFVSDQEKVHTLYTELLSSQRNPDQMFTAQENRVYSLQKRSNRFTQFGYTDITLVVGCCIKFIDTDETLKNVLMCCKDTNEVLRDEIYKQALLRTPYSIQKRPALWIKLLLIEESQIVQDYQAHKSLSEVELSKQIIDQIQVDINRSFKAMGENEISSQILKNILHANAAVDPSMEYCQGINFMAGFLYLLYKDEAKSFSVLKHVISKYDMIELFNTDTRLLKLSFYKLDRMISVCLPDLHQHFKEENINASLFATTFFITLFTQVLQSQQVTDRLWKLQRIWDFFMVYGWKAIYKVSVLILKQNEEKLLASSFEMILSQLPFLPLKFIFNEPETPENVRKFDKQMQGLKMRTLLLQRLSKEFEDSVNILK